MGVVFRGKFIYFNSPRTGSNSVQYALTGRYSGGSGPVHSDFFRIGQHMSRPEMETSFPKHSKLPGVCNIRNPFDILASWLHALPEHKSIRNLIKRCKNRNLIKHGLICYHVPFCDFIIKHGPDMFDRVNDILDHFKLPHIKQLPVYNVSENRPPYQEVYSQADIDAVRMLFQSELDDLNYDFEGEPLG